MKKLVLTLLFLTVLPPFASADTIFLKSGVRMDVDRAWEENGLVKCYIYGGIVAYSKEDVERIERVQRSESTDAPTEHLPGESCKSRRSSFRNLSGSEKASHRKIRYYQQKIDENLILHFRQEIRENGVIHIDRRASMELLGKACYIDEYSPAYSFYQVKTDILPTYIDRIGKKFIANSRSPFEVITINSERLPKIQWNNKYIGQKIEGKGQPISCEYEGGRSRIDIRVWIDYKSIRRCFVRMSQDGKAFAEQYVPGRITYYNGVINDIKIQRATSLDGKDYTDYYLIVDGAFYQGSPKADSGEK